jgi:predicted ATPase
MSQTLPKQWERSFEMGSLVFCNGTGRTGKTVLAEELEKEGWIRHKSPTRGFFQSKGISSEGDLFARPQPERAQIQREYFDFFMADLEKVTTDTPSATATIVFERGPIDMFSYLLFHDWAMTRDEYEGYITRVTQFLERCVQRGWTNYLVLFPYPTEWMRSVDTDAFRHSKFGKDMTIHALVNNTIVEVSMQIPNEVVIIDLSSEGTPKDRVEEIKEAIADNVIEGTSFPSKYPNLSEIVWDKKELK